MPNLPLRRFVYGLLPMSLLLVPGCAKSPGNSGSTSPVSGPQLLVSMTVAGRINPSYYYYILFNTSNTATSSVGPVPVVAPPYGNGFAAGAFTNYVEYNGSGLDGTGFGFYTISADLLTPKPLGTGQLIQKQVSGGTLTFQIPLAYLATQNITVDQIQSLQINFVATNVAPVVGQTLAVPKFFDALYPPTETTSYVNIVTRGISGSLQPGIYRNGDANIEGSNDVAQYVGGLPVTVADGTDPSLPDGTKLTVADLDITDFTIQLNGQ
jgi:hypothetical protein